MLNLNSRVNPVLLYGVVAQSGGLSLHRERVARVQCMSACRGGDGDATHCFLRVLSVK